MADSAGNPNTIPHAISGGQMQELTAAQVSTKYGAGNIKTPTKNFTLNYGGQHMNCLKNIPIVCSDPVLLALLVASGNVV